MFTLEQLERLSEIEGLMDNPEAKKQAWQKLLAYMQESPHVCYEDNKGALIVVNDNN